jgi:hypothetical protein
MSHPFSIIAATYAEAVAAAETFIADSNAADFVGIPATSYTVAETTGILGTNFVVTFNGDDEPESPTFTLIDTVTGERSIVTTRRMPATFAAFEAMLAEVQ